MTPLDQQHPAKSPVDRPREILSNRRLGFLALGAAIVALLLAVALPTVLLQRQEGPVISHTDLSLLPGGTTLASAPTCTHVTGSEVTITVPGAGTIVVIASGRAVVNHTFGLADTMSLFLSNSSTSCQYPFAWVDEIPATWSSEAFMDLPFSFHTTFTVSRGGTYTIFLNGNMWQGGDSEDKILTVSLAAVFCPS